MPDGQDSAGVGSDELADLTAPAGGRNGTCDNASEGLLESDKVRVLRLPSPVAGADPLPAAPPLNSAIPGGSDPSAWADPFPDRVATAQGCRQRGGPETPASLRGPVDAKELAVIAAVLEDYGLRIALDIRAYALDPPRCARYSDARFEIGCPGGANLSRRCVCEPRCILY